MIRKIGIFLFFFIFFISTKVFPNTDQDVTKIYIAGIPKCGTHLLQKVVFILNNNSFENIEQYPHPDNFERDYTYFRDHTEAKFVLIIRDPRDALVSAYDYVWDNPINDQNENKYNYWHKPLRNNPDYPYMTKQQRLSEMIKMGKKNLLIGSTKIHTGYRVAAKTQYLKNVLIVRFEDLIGTFAGGDDAVRHETIKEIAKFLSLPESNVDLACHKSWGGEDQHGYKTFSKGVAGRWKENFDKQNIKDIKTHGWWNLFITSFGYESDAGW
ncbi:MAG: sulfotransferase domain-containing protein [Chlamydiae bacterium]|nr:sulfotransferase domain-containing protein [Chlamydiota bacterium]